MGLITGRCYQVALDIASMYWTTGEALCRATLSGDNATTLCEAGVGNIVLDQEHIYTTTQKEIIRLSRRTGTVNATFRAEMPRCLHLGARGLHFVEHYSQVRLLHTDGSVEMLFEANQQVFDFEVWGDRLLVAIDAGSCPVVAGY